jgi:hypothetical protein
MWIIDNAGAISVMSNNPDDKISEAVAAGYPGAAIYVCRQPDAFATYAAHVGATITVMAPVEFPDPDDPDGPLLTGEQPQQVSAGNTVAILPDGPALALLLADGTATGSLTITPAA